MEQYELINHVTLNSLGKIFFQVMLLSLHLTQKINIRGSTKKNQQKIVKPTLFENNKGEKFEKDLRLPGENEKLINKK